MLPCARIAHLIATRACCLLAGAAPPPAEVIRTFVVDAIYGVFQLLRGHYLAVVTKSQLVGKAPYDAPVYRIEDMDWIHIPANFSSEAAQHRPLTLNEEEEEQAYVFCMLSNMKF